MASIAEISKRTGFSTATVSRVLDPRLSGKVRPKTKEKILEVCRELNFAPKFSARALASGKTFTIGMIMPWVEVIGTSPTFSRLLSSISNELQKHGYTLAVLPVASNKREILYNAVVDAIHSSRVDGVMSFADFLDEHTLRTILSEKVPIATFSMPSDPTQSLPGVNHVRVDETRAINRLLDLFRRHGRIAMLLAPTRHSSRGRILAELGTSFFVERDDFFAFDNAAAGMHLVNSRWEELSEYSAWIAQNDRIAYGASLALREHGVIPGKDIVLAGFDNIEYGFEHPFLTTIHPPYEEMAKECVRHLLTMLNDPDSPPAASVIPAELILRESSKIISDRYPEFFSEIINKEGESADEKQE